MEYPRTETGADECDRGEWAEFSYAGEDSGVFGRTLPDRGGELDLSKNAVTGRIVASACENSALPLLITRDAVDIVAENGPEKLLMKENLVIMASVAQLMKLLRSVYYPKMLLMTQSLVQVVEVLHKFTLSYPAVIATLHNGQILVAKDGEVVAVPLEKSGHSALTFWMGEMAAKIAALNLYNPNNFVPATVTAVFA